MRGRSHRHRIRFDQPVDKDDGIGGFIVSWEPVCTERGEIERIKSLRVDVERIQAGSRESMPIVRIHIDSHSITRTLDNTMRAVDLDGGKTFDINSVQDLDGDNRSLTITATENAAS